MACKYPIVLVHGLMIRHFKRHRAFGKISSALENEGHRVFVATHDGFGAIETNAAQLKVFILEVLKKTGAKKVNVIAHSKGGLDIEYAIINLGIADKIATLTTLCTPHKGSVLASLIWRMPRVIRGTLAFFINGFYRLLGDRSPNALKACFQLRLKKAPYAESLPGDIMCQSYSARMKRSRDCFLLSLAHAIYKKRGGEENDGLVSTESAKFGLYRGDASDESLSHGHMVDFATPKKKREEVIAFYKSMTQELALLGY